MRNQLVRARRIVVKIGSSSLVDGDGTFGRIARDVAAVAQRGTSVAIVSSGAIALGWRKLGYKTRPREVKKLQAAAAAGQSSLMRAWEEAFASHRRPVAQVLLTHADLADKARMSNAREALGELLRAGAVPILNENDSVAVEEIKLGDNDQLAAMVTPLVGADLLVMLSDVRGVLDTDGERIPFVGDARELSRFVKKGKSASGTGGMASKILAALRASLAGAHTVIADAREGSILERIVRGDDVGTMVLASSSKMSARKSWIAFTLRARGDVVLDGGAVKAVIDKHRSVLAVGVMGVRGAFREGDAVRIVDGAGVEVGRGLARIDAEQALRVAGKAAEPALVVIHRDDLVLWQGE